MTDGKPLPHNPAAEAQLLCAILVQATVYDRVSSIVQPADFYDSRHRAAYTAIVEMEGRGVDLLTLKDHLREAGRLEDAGGTAFLSALLDHTHTDVANSEKYAEMIRDDAHRRRVIREAQRLQVAAQAGQPLDQIVTAAAALASDISSTRDRGPESIRDLARSTVRTLERRMTTEDLIGDNIETPLQELNVCTTGFPRQVETVIGARTRVGKTAFAITCAIRAIESGHRVLFIELDMSASMFGVRTLANVSDVSAYKIRTGQKLEASELDRIRSGNQTLQSWGDRLVIDTNTRNLALLSSLIRREARAGLDMIIVDHIGHVKGGKGTARYIELGDVSSSLIEVAGETNAALLTLVQLGRQAEQREPVLADLRESGNLEQDARIVLLLDRPNLREPAIAECSMKILVAKNEGENGHRFAAHFDLRSQRITSEAEAPSACAFCSTSTSTSRRWGSA